MSRIGNKPITVPDGVEVKIDGHKITVKGPKGTLEREVHKNISLEMNDNVIKVTRKNDEPANRSLHGLTRTLINNMIIGYYISIIQSKTCTTPLFWRIVFYCNSMLFFLCSIIHFFRRICF